MSNRSTLLILTLAVLSACQVKPPVTPGASTRPGARPPAVVPGASATPAGVTPVTAKPGRLLRKPATPTRLVSGAVSIDAGYLVSTRAGQVISNDGASLVAAGSGAIISNDGASISSNDGATIVSGGSGNIIANDGASIIANDGASIISNDGASLIGQDGAGIISGGAGNYGLLQTAGAPVGETLPAAGMAVYVVSMRDNRALPIGVDEDGQKVYVAYTDIKGGFNMYLPPDIPASTLRIVAAVPGAADARLRYALVASQDKTENLAFTEDNALAGAFVRSCFTPRLRNIFRAVAADEAGADLAAGLPLSLPDGLRDTAKDILQELFTAAKAAGGKELGEAGRERLTQLLADQLVGSLRPEELTVYVEGEGTRSALSTVALSLGELRLAATKRMGPALDKGAFADAPFMVDVNRRRAARGEAAIAIEHPSDLPRIVVTEFIGSAEENQSSKISNIYDDLDLTVAQHNRFSAAGFAILIATIGAIMDDTLIDGKTALERAKLLIEAVTKEELAKQAGPGKRPVTPPADALTSEVVDVGTLLPASHPIALALDPKGLLYVIEDALQRISRIDLEQATLTLEPVAGAFDTASGTGPALAGYVDGPGPKARFSGPSALAFDASGRLYVADRFNQRIRAITFGADGTATVSTVAGGQVGSADGPGVAASFSEPGGLAFDAKHNRLIVSDYRNRRLRTVDLADGRHVVGTLAGNGATRFAGGLAPNPAFAGPTGLTFGVPGSPDADDLYIADTPEHLVARLRPDGRVTLVAGAGPHGMADGFWASALFSETVGLARDPGPRGGLLVADRANHAIRRITLMPNGAGQVTTVAGGALVPARGPLREGAFRNGAGAQAQFRHPTSIVVRGRRAYIADSANDAIRVLTWPEP